MKGAIIGGASVVAGASAGPLIARPEVILPSIYGGLATTGIGSTIRGVMGYIETKDIKKAVEKAFNPKDVALDFTLGAVSGGTYGILSKTPLTELKVLGLRPITGISTATGLLAEDVLRDVLNKEKIEIAEDSFFGLPGWSKYIVLPFGVMLMEGAISKASELHRKGKLHLPKLSKAKFGEEEVYALTIEKGPESKPIIGIKFGKDAIKIGGYEQLKIDAYSPDFGMPKTPFETALIKDAMKNYYVNKQGLTPEQFEVMYLSLIHI